MRHYIILVRGGINLIVYIDLFIIENFIVNFFLLYITMQTIRVRPRMLYLAISALLGALYSLIAFYTKFNYFFFIPNKLLFAALMIIIAIRSIKLILFVKSFLIFILYSMFFAGICLFIEINNNSNINLFIKNISYKTLLFGIMVIYIIIHRIVYYIRDRKELDKLIYDVEIVTSKKVFKVKAFLDTGNELREPATNLPVMIVEANSLLDCEIKDKLVIPYRVISGLIGKFEGFKPKYINVYCGKGVKQREVVIAICHDMLSESHEYDALLSRGIL